MKKWEDPLIKNDCHCDNNQGLFIPNRQLSCIVAAMLFLVFCVFMTGYFLGKKKVVEQISEKIQQDAFADHIYASVITQGSDINQKKESDIVAYDTETISESEIKVVELIEDNEKDAKDTLKSDSLIAPHYYAQLIGFGTEKAAQLFVRKLATKGIETEIKKHASKTAKGRTSYWYQVITPMYSNKDELISLVNRITKEENIKDANIRVC